MVLELKKLGLAADVARNKKTKCILHIIWRTSSKEITYKRNIQAYLRKYYQKFRYLKRWVL